MSTKIYNERTERKSIWAHCCVDQLWCNIVYGLWTILIGIWIYFLAFGFVRSFFLLFVIIRVSVPKLFSFKYIHAYAFHQHILTYILYLIQNEVEWTEPNRKNANPQLNLAIIYAWHESILLKDERWKQKFKKKIIKRIQKVTKICKMHWPLNIGTDELFLTIFSFLFLSLNDDDLHFGKRQWWIRIKERSWLIVAINFNNEAANNGTHFLRNIFKFQVFSSFGNANVMNFIQSSMVQNTSYKFYS